MIRPVKTTDSSQLAEIYNHYVLNSISTFELEPIDEAEMCNRINTISAKYPYIVFEENGQVMGHAYASEWKVRKAYANSVESSVYLHPTACSKGIGSKLYSMLLNELKKQDIHAVIGGISLPNKPSIALHEKLGFEKIGQFKEVGKKFNKWIDVGYWQLLF